MSSHNAIVEHSHMCTSSKQKHSKSSRGIMSVAGGGNTTSVILNETCFERYIHTNFGGRDLSGFGDIATFKNGQISLSTHGL